MKALTTLVPADTLKAPTTDAEIAEGQYDLIAARGGATWRSPPAAATLVYRNADGSTRVSNDYSFNVFEQRNGRWMYAAALLPWRVRPRSGSTFRPSR